MRRRPLPYVLVGFFLVSQILSGCGGVRSFSLTVDGLELALLERPGRLRKAEGVVAATQGGKARVQYTIKASGALSGLRQAREGDVGRRDITAGVPEGKALAIEYSGDASGAYLIPLYRGRNGAKDEPALREGPAVPFPRGSSLSLGKGGDTEFLLELDDSSAFRGVRVERRWEGEQFVVTGISLVEPWRGISLEGSALSVSSGGHVSRKSTLHAWRLRLPPPPAADAAMVLRYDADPSFFVSGGERPVTATLAVSTATGGPTDEITLELRLRPGSNHVILYPTLLGLVPGDLTFSSGSADVSLQEVYWQAKVSDSAARTADLGTILAESSRDDLALFRWNLYPDVLVLVFDDYATQSAYLKRAAFFVEKVGYRGRVATFEELAPRHGWNAHNYSPSGLASFFSEASTISQEEERLRDIALANGIIVEETDGFVPGRGGVISIARESEAPLQRLLLTHEAMHGVFYSESDFVDAVWEIWQMSDPRFREAWRFFLASMTYDPEDEYLMVNEFQAYLLQQPLEETEGYHWWRLAGRSRARDPQGDRFSDAFLREFVGRSTEAAERLNDVLFATTGLVGGDAICLASLDDEASFPRASSNGADTTGGE